MELSPEFNVLEDKWSAIGENLAESWKKDASYRVKELVKPAALQQWKAGLTDRLASHYIYAFASNLRSTLLNCYSEISGPSDGYLIVLENQPIKAEFRVPQDSRFARENKYINGFLHFDENTFCHDLQIYYQDVFASIAVPHIAESLRTRELTQLPKLGLTDLSPSIIKVTFQTNDDYNLG